MPIFRFLFLSLALLALLPLNLSCGPEDPAVPASFNLRPIPVSSNPNLLQQARRKSSRGAHRQAVINRVYTLDRLTLLGQGLKLPTSSPVTPFTPLGPPPPKEPLMADERVFVGDLTRKEFRERMQASTIKAAIVPTAATEQHNEHLHMIHDTFHASYMAEQAAIRLLPQVVVATPVAIGVSEHWMKHVGTLTVRPEIFCEYVFDVCHSLVRAGIENVLILNGHGGNVKPMMRRNYEYKDKLGINLRFQSYWDVYDPDFVQQYMEAGRLPGHADEFETSTMLYLAPERVQLEAIDNESAALGTREKGEALVGPAIDGVVDLLKKMIAGEEIDLPTVTFRPEGRVDLVSGEPL